MPYAGDDPELMRLRAGITEIDHALVAAFARRVELVRGVHEHKRARGVPLHDAAREEEIVRGAGRAAPPSLSPAGASALLEAVLALTKRELGAGDPPPQR